MVKSLEESKRISLMHLNRLIDLAGSQAQLARMLSSQDNYSVTLQGVNQWLSRSQISKRGARAVVRHPDFSAHFNLKQLRPDIPEEEWGEVLNETQEVKEGTE